MHTTNRQFLPYKTDRAPAVEDTSDRPHASAAPDPSHGGSTKGPSAPFKPALPAVPDLTDHAAIRMQQRRISTSDIDAAMSYGSLYETRDAAIFVVGRREIREHDRVPEVTADLNGLHVICTPDTGAVITVYRDPDFKRSSFDTRRRHR